MNFFLCIFAILSVLFCVPPCKSDTIYNSNNNNNNNNNNDDDHHNGEKNNNFSGFCMDVRPQHSLDIEQIMGMWYGNEIIKHTQEVPGIFHINSCVVIDLSDITQQMQANVRDYNYNNYRRTSTGTYQQQQQQVQQQHQPQITTKYLRLIWNEQDDNLEYTFNYTASMPGLWNNVDDQRGSLVVLNKYNQFRGSVQVVKAVHDHLVLTFCGNDERSSIYSIVLSRQPEGLSSKDLRGIRNMLSRRGLSTETIHKVCSSGAVGIRSISATVLFLILSLLYVVVKKL